MLMDFCEILIGFLSKSDKSLVKILKNAFSQNRRVFFPKSLIILVKIVKEYRDCKRFWSKTVKDFGQKLTGF